jgi:predicted transcriptional regulator
MAGAPKQGIWVTIQAHGNIVAVAALLELTAVIITEGAMPDENTIQKANDEGVTLLSTSNSTFSTIGQLWEMGLRNP